MYLNEGKIIKIVKYDKLYFILDKYDEYGGEKKYNGNFED